MNLPSDRPDRQSRESWPSRPHVCPWWLGYLMACPIRRIVERPERLLAPYVRPGMIVLEPGCGMGYFSLPLARAVGSSGRVICVDLQPRMIEALVRRARRAGLHDRIDAATCSADDLGIGARRGKVDMAVLIHMFHEVPDPAAFVRQVGDALRPGGRVLIREPPGHVSREAFEASLAIAEKSGLRVVERHSEGRRREALLERPEILPR